jgi:hypothetical protein
VTVPVYPAVEINSGPKAAVREQHFPEDVYGKSTPSIA